LPQCKTITLHRKEALSFLRQQLEDGEKQLVFFHTLVYHFVFLFISHHIIPLPPPNLFSVDMFNVPSWLFEVDLQEDTGSGSSTFLSILAEMSHPGLGTVLAHV